MKNKRGFIELLTIVLIAVVVIGAFVFFNEQNGSKTELVNGSIVQVPNNNSNNGTQLIGGQRDEHGCLGPAGYSWNATEKACVREWLNTSERYQTTPYNATK